MTDPEHETPSFLSLLRRIRLSPEELAVFAREDTAATLEKVRILSVTAVFVNSLALRRYGGRLGPTRGFGLVEQVIGAAFQSFGGEDPHAGPYARAAMLLRGVTQGHPFNDGNKRTGFLMAAAYLDLVRQSAPSTLDIPTVVEFCVRVSAGDIRDVDAIEDALRGWWGADPR